MIQEQIHDILNNLGNIAVEEKPSTDTLAIALITYFHSIRNESGNEEARNQWALNKTNAALNLVRQTILQNVNPQWHHGPPGNPTYPFLAQHQDGSLWIMRSTENNPQYGTVYFTETRARGLWLQASTITAWMTIPKLPEPTEKYP